ncbi:MAG: flagellar biosynthesis protein FlgN [Tateyamaria sp.]
MKDDRLAPLLDELDDLLDAERQALLDGKLDQVERMFKRKTALMDALGNPEPGDETRIEDVRSKLLRNRDLLGSAAEGIRSVAQRLATVRRVRHSLETYDERGQRKSVNLTPGSSLEKRA